MRRVSRNIDSAIVNKYDMVTPRMRRVSRNASGNMDVNESAVTPRMRRVSRNSNVIDCAVNDFRHASHEACE